MSKVDHKERVNYVTEHHEDGRTSYTGVSVNYGGVCSSWESVEDLERKQKALIHAWCNMGKEMADKDLEMHEMTIEEWEGKDDNIDYWEIERMKRILKRSTIQEMLIPELTEVLGGKQAAIFAISTIINTQVHEK